MPDMTALQVITGAYRKIGLITPSTTQLANGLEDLQNMLSLWSVKGLHVSAYVTETLTLTTSQSVYTIGENGSPDFNTIRPAKLIGGFIRVSNSDYPVNVNLSFDDYNSIVQKSVNSTPKNVYYDPQYPNANLKFDYPAESALAFHLTSEKIITNPTSTTTTFSIPLEYNEPMITNLAIRLTPDKNTSVHPALIMLASEGMTILENYNSLEKLSTPVRIENSIVFGAGRGVTSNYKVG